MDDIENAVQNDSPAAQNQEASLSQEESKLDPRVILEALEESDNALAKAEEKIVRMKKEAKQLGSTESFDDEDIEEKISRLVEEKLSQAKPDNDEVLLSAQKVREKNKELIATLKSKKGITNAGVGSSQSHHEVEEDPKKGYSQADLAVYTRVASRKGLSLEEYLRTLKK